MVKSIPPRFAYSQFTGANLFEVTAYQCEVFGLTEPGSYKMGFNFYYQDGSTSDDIPVTNISLLEGVPAGREKLISNFQYDLEARTITFDYEIDDSPIPLSRRINLSFTDSNNRPLSMNVDLHFTEAPVITDIVLEGEGLAKNGDVWEVNDALTVGVYDLVIRPVYSLDYIPKLNACYHIEVEEGAAAQAGSPYIDAVYPVVNTSTARIEYSQKDPSLPFDFTIHYETLGHEKFDIPVKFNF